MADTGIDLTKLSDAQLGALKMVGGDLTKLPDDVLTGISASLKPKEATMGDRAVDAVGKIGSAAKTAYDYAQTAGTRVLSGAAGMPSDVAAVGNQGAKFLLEKMLGPSLRTSGPGAPVLPDQTEVMPGSADIKKSLLAVNEKLGVPERNLADVKALTLTNPLGFEGKVNLGSMLDTGVDTGVSMLAGPGGMANAARNFIPGFMGGITSDAAGQATKGTKYETPARIAGTILGAGPTMLAQSLLRKSEGITAPFTQAGKERLAQDVVGGVATDPTKAVSILDQYRGDAIPGVNQTAAKITADPGLLSMENYVYGSAGGNQRLQSMVEGNNAARTAHLGSLESGDVGNFVARLRTVDQGLARDVQQTLDALPPSATPAQAGIAIRDALETHRTALTDARRNAVQPLYDEVAAWSAPVDARNARIAATEMVDTTKGDLQNTARTARNNLYTAAGQPDNTAQGLVAARQDMAHRLSQEGVTPAQERVLNRTLGATDQALEEAVPAARQARDTYRQMSVPLEPFDRRRAPSIFNAINPERPMDPGLIPSSILRTGEPGAAGVRSLRATGAPGAVEPLPGYVADMVRRDPANAGRIATNYAPGLNEIDPNLGVRIGAVANTQDVQAGFRSSPAGRIATGNTPAKEIGTVLSSGDGRTQIGDMLLRSAGDDTALAGLRKGILDDFKTAIESRGGTSAAGDPTLMSAQAKNWITLKMENASAALTADQRRGIEALADSLDVQSRVAPKMAGSDTIRNAMSDTFMGQILNNGIAKVPGLSLMIKADATKAEVIRIVADALADPEVARAMLMKYNAANAKIAEPIFNRLAKQQALAAPQEAGGRK